MCLRPKPTNDRYLTRNQYRDRLVSTRTFRSRNLKSLFILLEFYPQTGRLEVAFSEGSPKLSESARKEFNVLLEKLRSHFKENVINVDESAA